MNAYVITVATLVTIQSIVACGLNVIVGYAGQISLGHAAFFGIGAYASALLTTKAGLSFWTALPLAVAITASVGLMLGLPSLRVRDDFLAITTIGVNFIVEAIFLYIPFLLLVFHTLTYSIFFFHLRLLLYNILLLLDKLFPLLLVYRDL